jgi:DNA polymerase I-like protein with 3'-5' exonuclease and polymerase domains
LQGTGADGFRRALALLYERRGKCSGAVPILVAHDELAVECPEGQAKELMRFVEEAIVGGMDNVLNGTGGDRLRVPVEVEVEMVET